MNLREKIKHRILANFADYDNYLFIGTFIERRIELAGLSGDIDVINNELCNVTCYPKLGISRAINTFREDIQLAVERLFDGSITELLFIDEMSEILSDELTEAWHEGALECDVQPDELTQDEIGKLQDFIQNQISFLPGFGDAIIDSEELELMLTRSELWVTRYNEAKTLGAAMACADEKRIWELGLTEENCDTCAGLENKVYRFSTWLAYDAYPKSEALECEGFLCDCVLDKTDERITPGRFPVMLLG